MKNFNRLLAALCIALISVPAYAGRNGSGTYTAPSNSWNPVVTGTAIDSSDFNDLLDDLEAALTASIAKDGQTTATARIPFASGISTGLGSTSSVAYGFTGDLNTGIYSSTADKLGLVAGGTEQIRIESALVAPIANNTVDLGSSSNKFKDFYVAGTSTVAAIAASGLITGNANVYVANGSTSAGLIRILEDSDDGSNYTSISVPAMAGNIALVLPADDGDANELLGTDGSGNLDYTKIGASNIASAMITGQTDATIAAGDTILFTDASDSNNLKEDDIQGILDLIPDAITSGTPTTTTSGTAVNYTDIPAGTKRITVNFSGVSTNGTANILIQLGDSGGVETSGYTGSSSGGSSGVNSANFSNGFGIVGALAANVYQGSVILSLVDSSTFTWSAFGLLQDGTSASFFTTAGSKSLSATLDRIRVTTSNGTDTFDAGKINILYE